MPVQTSSASVEDACWHGPEGCSQWEERWVSVSFSLQGFRRAVEVSVMLTCTGTCWMVLSPRVALICHILLSPRKFCLLPACAGSELALQADKIHLQMECCLFSHRYLFSLNRWASGKYPLLQAASQSQGSGAVVNLLCVFIFSYLYNPCLLYRAF